MRKILFITFEFHPVQTTGNFRAANFVKYFSEFGFEPIVLCGSEKSILEYFRSGKSNPALLEELPPALEVHRVDFDRPYKPVSKYQLAKYYADPINDFWKENAFKKAAEIIAQHPAIEAVLVTMPPFSVGELALRISKEFNLPLFLDLRDAWSHQGQFPYFTRLHYMANRHKENKLLKHATGIITVTNQLAEIYAGSNKEIERKKFDIVYNSYDKYDVTQQPPIRVQPASKTEKYIVGYIGAFYFNTDSEKMRLTPWWKRKGMKKFFYYSAVEEWLYRSPFFFFKALSLLFSKNPELRQKIFFGHIGDTPPWIYEMAREFGVEANVISYGFVKKDGLAEVVRNFSALLATTEKIPVNRSFCLPSKTFDYIKYGKPIIGFVKEGDYSVFLEKANMGVLIDPDRLEEELIKLEQFLLESSEWIPEKSYISSFHAREQTRRLSMILKEKLS